MKKVYFAIKRPDLAKQFHPTKNEGTLLDDLLIKDDQDIWWLCEFGHVWQAKIYNRVRQKKAECPKCTSLASKYPHLLKEIHPTKNLDFNAVEISPGSPKKIIWICSKGHEYEAQIKNRTNKGSGCPSCSGRSIVESKSINATHSWLLKYLHPEKNIGLDFTKISASSKKLVWWVCENHHEWQEILTTVAHRKKIGCVTCASLGFKKPALLLEWDSTNVISPYVIAANCNEKVKWCCKNCGHYWEASVANRYGGSGCPGCSGAVATVATSLEAHYPEISAQWDFEKNKKLPKDYTAGSEEVVYWLCPNGHSYQKSIYDRTKKERSCPDCKTFAFICPDLVEEWHSSDISPNIEMAGSGKAVEWRCKKCDYIWRTKIVDRYNGSGCPRCNNGWTVEKIRDFVSALLPYLHTLSQADLFIILQAKGLIGTYGVGRHFIKSLITGKLPKVELEKFCNKQTSIIDGLLNENANESLHEEGLLAQDLSEEQVCKINDFPLIETKDILASVDSQILSSFDEEVVEYLVESKVAAIWRHVFLAASNAIEQLEQYKSDNVYAAEIRNRFTSQYESTVSLLIPEGYSAKFPVNLMQRYIAHRLTVQKRIGNWSGTGAGKTFSAVLASRVIGAKLTLICCPNNVINTWVNEINSTYPDSKIIIKSLHAKDLIAGKHNYVLLNYEYFQQPAAEARLKVFLEENNVDFVVIDEVHYSKQRIESQISRRLKTLAAFLSEASAKNENLHVLGMSATPVINTLLEGKALLELITGVYHDDLNTKLTRDNCVALYKKLVIHGIRYKPPYSCQLNEFVDHIDCSMYLPEIRKHKTYAELEAILTKAKIPYILKLLKSGPLKTIIYTHYIQDILEPLRVAIESEGWRVAVYTGDEKDHLENDFINGRADVLIASSCVGTGVDGLQRACNRIIINSLPWTNAEFEQLRGRVYRQHQSKDRVEIFIPLTYAEINGQRWSWCESRWQRIQYKKSVADAAVDGVIPEGQLRTPAQAHKAIMVWLERLECGKVNELTRRKIEIPLVGDITSVGSRRLGDLSIMNQQINRESSDETHKRFIENPAAWLTYHASYREDRKSWPVVPYQEAVAWLIKRSQWVVADFGCGEAFLASELPNKVYSFDHIAFNENVIACDMAKVPCKDNVLDAAVFSLSLMGSNFVDYIREARRCLKLDGHLWIAEPTSRIESIEALRDLLERLGFDVFSVSEKWKFTFIRAIKTDRAVNEIALTELLNLQKILN